MVRYKHRLEEWKDDDPGIKHKLEMMTRGRSVWIQNRVGKDGLVSLQNQSIREKMDSPEAKPEFKGRRKHRTEEWTRDNYIQSQIRGGGQLKINVECRTWDGLEFTGVIVLLKPKVIGRKKIKGPVRDRQKSVTYDYGRILDLMIITI